MKKIRNILIYGCIMLTVLGYSLSLLKESFGNSNQSDIKEVKEQLEILAKWHRASGSNDQKEAADYIESLLISNQMNYEVQMFRLPYVSWLESKEQMIGRNILIHLDAKGTEDAVLFVSHYDCKKAGNGVGDNGLSVIAALNSVFNIDPNELNNDIYLLLTDGEEIGLFGASNFVQKNKDLLEKVKLVVNLEGGMSGSYLLTRTSGLERGSIELAKDMVSDFSGSSFLDSIFRLSRYRTDIEPFTDRNMTGLDFTRMETMEAYHNPNDNFGVMKESTMKETVKTINELIVGFGKADLGEVTDKAPVNYFPVTKKDTVVLPYGVVIFLFIASLIGFIIFVHRSRKHKKYNHKKWFPALLTVCETIVIIGMLIFIVILKHELDYGKYLNLASNDLRGYQDFMKAGDTSYQLFIITMLLTTIVTCFLGWFLIRKRKISYETYTILVFLFVILGIASMIWMKGALYVIAIPLFCISIGSTVIYYLPKSKWICHILMILCTFIIIGPIAWIIFVGLHNVLTYMATIAAGIVISIYVLLMLSAICFSEDEKIG